MHLSPKYLGLNAGLRDCFGQSGIEFSGLISDSPEPKFWDYFRIVWSWIMRLIFGLSMCIILCVLLKVNNMCSCENHVVICSIDGLAWISC